MGASTQTAPTFFARKATGLVRESSVWNTAAFNILNVTVAYAILYPALFAWQFPGSNLLLGGVLSVAAFVPLGLCYALIVAAMPRSGSDYVFVSRVFHPSIGFIVAIVFMCWVSFWSGLGINFFFTVGLAPQMATLGLPDVGDFFTKDGVVIAFGAALLIAMGAMTALSTRWAMRVLTVLVGRRPVRHAADGDRAARHRSRLVRQGVQRLRAAVQQVLQHLRRRVRRRDEGRLRRQPLVLAGRDARPRAVGGDVVHLHRRPGRARRRDQAPGRATASSRCTSRSA